MVLTEEKLVRAAYKLLACVQQVARVSSGTTHSDELRTSRTVTQTSLLGTPRWRSVGPSRGGRSVAIAGHPDEVGVFYFGACAGGIWKTNDGGTYWRNVSDGWLGSSSIGALAVARARPDTVWAGTGEACVRNNVVAGDGVYRSTDGGQSWQHSGLTETRHIARIRIEDGNPDAVWVAALGDIFGPNGQRGVFRSPDGGRTWQHLLHVSDRGGACDLSLDPNNPNVAFAAIWQAIRSPWEMSSGGPDSDLYRTLDGGHTWQAMSESPGFSTALKGRIGVAVSPARPDRVYAVVEAADDESGIYRSDDRGDSWTRVNAESAQTGRPWYYSHIFADPLDPDSVYTCNVGFWRSRDGGATFTQVQTPHGDNHDLWLDPVDPRRMGQANDGGACISFNGGATFSTVYNQSTAQIYRVDVGREFPFDLYGTQQDNSGIRVPSRSWKGAIRWPDCLELGEAEAGDVACDPLDPRYVYLGGGGFGHPGPLLRFDQVTEQAQDVAVWVEHFLGTDPMTHRHRFGWTFPIRFSPHNPGLLYACGERVFRSRDAGMSWEAASPDLSGADPELLKASGGPINKDTSGAEVFCTIHAFAESPISAGVLWAGTDDGLVHVSTDDGAEWREVTPAELPARTTIAGIEPAVDDERAVYVVAHRYRLQDRRAIVLASTDLGASWTSLAAQLPDDCVLRCIRQDRENPEVLYLATDQGVLVSTDRGASWEALGAGLPPVPVYDLAFRAHELVAATHGRGFWMLDDLTPIRAVHRVDGVLTTYPPPTTYRYPTPTGFDMKGEGTWVGGAPGIPLGGAAFTPQAEPDGSTRNVVIAGGENPPNGVAIWYRLGSDVPAVSVQVAAADGTVLRTITGERQPGRPKPAPPLPVPTAGLHYVVWDLRIDAAVSAPEENSEVSEVTPGPRVPPGRYEITVRAGDHTQSQQVEVVRDPRLASSDADLQAQYDLLLDIRDCLDEAGRAVAWIRGRLPSVGPDEAERLRAYQHELIGAHASFSDALKYAPGLIAKIVLLPEIVVELSDTAPTHAARTVWAQLRAELFSILDELHRNHAMPETTRRNS